MRRHINPITVEVDQMNNNNNNNNNNNSVIEESSAAHCTILSDKNRLLLQHRIIKGMIVQILKYEHIL